MKLTANIQGMKNPNIFLLQEFFMLYGNSSHILHRFLSKPNDQTPGLRLYQ